MAQRRKRDLPPTQHAEGRPGDKTHRRFIEQLQEPQQARPLRSAAPVEGRHRLQEDRQQHDEAEKNSEANR